MSASGGRGGGALFGFAAFGRMGVYMRVRVVSVSMLSGRSLGLGSGVGDGLGEAGAAPCASPPASPRSVDVRVEVEVEVEAALGGGGPGRCDWVKSEMTGLGVLGAAFTGGPALACGVGDLLLRCFL